ncbi:hypothetical protein PSECIP111951_01762 [Pseudoalteromonas holothuriae]|uniref:Peptidase M19 n=1 Tax=Pseudoalteromonas holothuriae TaxID=2963714 RepID=A0A9W4VVW9_9GAMM|nr:MULTISPECIES: membrane dipeptidase [unclassified Pseudoalteromonas]CAH9057904.1 hypothetical protein PSECIP111951_01762 [Pseudoalteromonas sp. CIP111951]CAH9058783.1 hypothetical protein PSECIP111854_02272 [Pseudoalteromonas sp. CIP111854]
MKLMKYCLLAILVLVGVRFTVVHFVPSQIDKRFNTTIAKAPYQASQAAITLYNSLPFIADMHSDSLLWQRDLLQSHAYGHQDIPRMIEANQALQIFTIVSKVPKNKNFHSNPSDSDSLTLPFILFGRPVQSWFDLTQRAVVQAKQLHMAAKLSGGTFSVITNKAQLVNYLISRQNNKVQTAGLLGIEGAHALSGNLENIDVLYDEGIRMIGLAHFFDNEVGGSAHGVEKHGLTEFGKQALQKMEGKGMFIDLSHASPALFADVIEHASKPVVVSHTGVKGTCDNNRNLSDEQLRQIAKSGGLVSIAFFETALCGNSVQDAAQAIIYTAKLIGTKHVALGSDFDGAIKALFEVRGLVTLVDALLELGMSQHDIKLIFGENVKDFLINNLPN